MARSFRGLLLPVLLLVSASAGTLEAENIDCCKQRIGCGYGPGYNAPAQPGAFNWGRGCCEIPANWRLHVWDGYRGDPCAYQKSLVGAQPDVNHMPHSSSSRAYNTSSRCSNCQNRGGASMYQAPVPVADPAIDAQPSVRSGRAKASAKSLR